MYEKGGRRRGDGVAVVRNNFKIESPENPTLLMIDDKCFVVEALGSRANDDDEDGHERVIVLI